MPFAPAPEFGGFSFQQKMSLETIQQIASQRFENEEADALKAKKVTAELNFEIKKKRTEAAALEAAVVAELERLRNRSEIEVLRDEVAELKRVVKNLSLRK